MPLTADDWKLLIRDLVGDLDPATGASPVGGTGIIATNLDRYWDANAEAGINSLELQAHYTIRTCLSVLLSQLRGAIRTAVGGDTFDNQQEFDHLKQLAERNDGQIAAIEKRVRRSSGPVSGVLTATEPGTGPLRPWQTDAFDPALAGSPYSRRRRL